MPSKQVRTGTPIPDITFRENIKSILFPPVYDIDVLPIDKNFPRVKLLHIRKTKSNQSIKIVFDLGQIDSRMNVYLFINGKKVDLFYSVMKGQYSFNNIFLMTRKNEVEIFYVSSKRKSPSTTFKINI